MSDWQIGDLALCVDARPSPFYKTNCGLTLGRTYRVTRVTLPGVQRHSLYGRETCGLFLVGLSASAPHGFASQRFRKIRPDEHEACEPEFVTLLKRSKRKVSA